MKRNITLIIITLFIITSFSISYAHQGEGNISIGRQCDEVTQDLLATSKDKLTDIDTGDLPKDVIVWDHIGFKDEAWSGNRHVYKLRKGGVLFQGYAQMPYNDLYVRPMNTNESDVITLGQAPLRADWHTLNGNGLIFGGDFKDDKFSGYSVVATMNKIEVREYVNVSKEAFQSGTGEYKVLASKPKVCPAQEFVIKDKKIYESGEILYDMKDKKWYGNYVGGMADFMEHNCGSLTTIYIPYLTVNSTNILI